MPPLEQPQLTKAEMELLHWWVSSGANFNKKVNALVQTEKIKPVLLALQSEEVKEELKISDVPAESVEIADQGTVKKIQERGIAITAVAQNSNYLSANFVAVEALTEKDLQLLDPIAKQLVWLKLGDSKLNDKMLTSISDLSALTRLSLERTAITDQGIGQLKNLGKLQYLNLIGTKVSAKGLEQLKGLKELRQIFLFQTLIQPSEADQLKKLFPNAKIDFGGYKLQFLESDTSKLKDPKLK
jgi:Leucine-rich repeat (LRR) protein